MRGSRCLPLLPTLLLASVAAAGTFDPAADGRVLAARGPSHPSQRFDALRAFAASRQRAAGAELLELSRDAERRRALGRIARSGGRRELAAYARELEAQAGSDELRMHRAVAEPEPAAWRELGPTTRRVLSESGIALQLGARSQRLRAELREAEHRIEAREAAPPPLAWRTP